MLVGRCVALGDGGKHASPTLSWLLGDNMTEWASGKKMPCSGRGKCTSDWHMCGPGGANATATPCCACRFGFAGAGCEELDVRIWLVLVVVVVLGGLLLGMALSSVRSMIAGQGGEAADRVYYKHVTGS